MNKISILLLAISSFVFWGCGSKEAPKTENEVTEKKEIKAKSFNADVSLPTLPERYVKMLVDSVDLIDYQYFNLPISMNFSDKAGILNGVLHIGKPSATMISGCEPFARVYYSVQGDIKLEADLYYSPPNCRYFTFFKPKAQKPSYGNLMTDKGDKFYGGLLEKMKNATQQ